MNIHARRTVTGSEAKEIAERLAAELKNPTQFNARDQAAAMSSFLLHDATADIYGRVPPVVDRRPAII